MLHLLLTLDYEIFGNGAGDVLRDVVRPTERLLDICDRHGARLTIMFEVGEYWAFERYAEPLRQDLGYSPAEAMRTQAVDAIRRGHDVQLHLHPWWIDATLENRRWCLHPEYMRISDLPNGMGSESDLRSIVGVLRKGKHTLESLIRPLRPDYECLVYRAAMFWGQPSEPLIEGLKKAGMAADSSVICGLYETGPAPTDYRQAPGNAGYWWTRAEEISQIGPEGKYIIEFPVHSRQKSYLCNLKWTKLHTTLKRRFHEQSNTHGYGMMQARRSTESLTQILRRLATRQPLKYDLCKLSARDMIGELRRLLKTEATEHTDVGTPIVMLGHSKDYGNDRNLAAFLKFAGQECADRVCFSTLAEFTTRILRRQT